MSSSYGDEEVARSMLENGANLNAHDEKLQTALRGDYRAVVRLLFEHGADVNIRDKDG